MGIGIKNIIMILLATSFLMACTDTIPEFEDLNSQSSPTFTDSEGDAINEISIFSSTDSVTLQGSCSSLYSSLQWLPEGASDYSEVYLDAAIDVVTSDLDCSNQDFRIEIPDISILFGVLSLGDSRTIQLRGENSGVTSSAAEITITYVDATTASPNPINLTASDVNENKISLDWQSGGGSTQGYRIAYTTGATAPTSCSGGGTLIPEGSIVGSSHTVTGLIEDQEYSFRVCSINSVPTESTGVTLTQSTIYVNNPPVAVDITNVDFDEDSSYTQYLNYSTQYSDPDGDAADSCSVSDVPSDWTITCGSCNPSGDQTCQLSITPAEDFNGAYSFKYQITANGKTSAAALVSGVVSSVPDVTKVSASSANGTYAITDVVTIEVHFDENIDVFGGPIVKLETGTTDREASFDSVVNNIISFNYTVQSGDISSDLEYIDINSLDLNAGSIYKSSTSTSADIILPLLGGGNSLADTSNIVIDGVAPTVSIGSPSAGTKVTTANESSFSVSGSCSEDGQNVSVNAGAAAASTSCSGGSWSMNVDISGETDSSSLSFSVSHSDSAGNTSTAALSLDKDTTAPNVTISSSSSVTAANQTSYSASGACSDGDGDVTLSGDFDGSPITTACSSNVWSQSLNFKNESDGTVNITAKQTDAHGNVGTESVGLTKNTDVVLSLTSTSTSGAEAAIAGNTLQITVSIDVTSDTDITFEYNLNAASTASAGSDYTGFTDGTTLTLSAGNSSQTYSILTVGADDGVVEADETIILDFSNASGTYVNASFDAAKDQFTGTITNDDSAPVLNSLSYSAGTYNSGHYIYFSANYDKAVNVTNTPRLILDVNGSTEYANYYSGNGTASIGFRYLVERGQEDNDGVDVTASIDLNTTGTIKDSAGNNAALSFTAPTGILTQDNPVPSFELPTCHNEAIAGDFYQCDIPNVTGVDILNVSDSSPVSQTDSESWSSTGTCSWLVLNDTAKTLSGTPSALDIGNCYLQITLKDGATTEHGSMTHKIHIRVLENRSEDLAAVYAGTEHACAISDDGLKCWGRNVNGTLGTGDNFSYSMAKPVLNLEPGNGIYSVLKMTGSLDHSCALVDDGAQNRVQCWGDGTYGKLGDGLSIDNYSPVDVNFTDDVYDVEAGYLHNCLISKYISDRNQDGAVHCWGHGASGKIGNGLTSNQPSPVAVEKQSDLTPLVGAVDLAAGREHACALIKDGTVYCWGRNLYGQLGLETSAITEAYRAYQVVGIGEGSNPKAIAITAGRWYTCAELNTGRVKCWGSNSAGELGLGSTIDYGLATGDMVDVSSLLTNYNDFGGMTPDSVKAGVSSSITTDGGFNCALFDGTDLKCWGLNSRGQLGREDSMAAVGDEGSEADLSLLINVDYGSGSLIDYTLGGQFACALVEDAQREVRCWGFNNQEQLGTGSASPTQIGRNPGDMGTNLQPVVGLSSGGGGFTTLDSGWGSASLNYSEGNLRVSAGIDGVRSIRALHSKSSGKWYFEVTIMGLPISNGASMYVGLGDSSAPATAVAVGSSSGSYGCEVGTGACYSAGASSGSLSPFNTVGDTISVAVDLDNGKIWYKINSGTWEGGGSPGSGTSPTFNFTPSGSYYPMANTRYSGDDFRFNFGASAFNASPPAGFNAWTTAP